uniref:Peptidyl-prolyl cis-trans isomerase FKBP42 n=1 Tax=Lygus hesperus TaxID=30085 RepID=A0A0A9VZS2_LYGHE
MKEKANVAFQENRFDAALEGYQYCADLIQAMGSCTPELVTALQVIRANVVMVLLKQSQYETAALAATMLLDDEEYPLPEDLLVKVLYRRGLASKNMGNIDAALADFKAAVQFSLPTHNVAAEREIALLSKRV